MKSLTAGFTLVQESVHDLRVPFAQKSKGDLASEQRGLKGPLCSEALKLAIQPAEKTKLCDKPNCKKH